MTESPSNPIAVRDEVLQVLYWMRGEGLGNSVSRARLQQFLQLDPSQVEQALADLIRNGHLEACGQDIVNSEVRLTESGIREGRRRFEEEFDSVLGHESHLVCDDPNCDCHSPENAGHCLGRSLH